MVEWAIFVAGSSVAEINEKNLGLLDAVLHPVPVPSKSLMFMYQEKIPIELSWLDALNEPTTIS